MRTPLAGERQMQVIHREVQHPGIVGRADEHLTALSWPGIIPVLVHKSKGTKPFRLGCYFLVAVSGASRAGILLTDDNWMKSLA